MRLTRSRRALLCALIALPGVTAAAAARTTPAPAPPAGTLPQPRARDLGIPFDGTPGPLNAITDVAGVLVGHTTLDLRLRQAEGRRRARCAPASRPCCRAVPTRSRIRSSPPGSRKTATAR